MLDAAESLFANGGPDALTVEAVIERAGTSAGAFYARFGDRDGLLEALHERFLGRLGELVGAIVLEGLSQPSLAKALAVAVSGSLDVARKHHDSLVFFVLFRAADQRLRQQGIAANLGFAKAFRTIALNHKAEIRHPDPQRAVDVAFRILFAMLVQQVMFEARELTGRPMADRRLAEQLCQAMLLYLTVPPA